MHTHTPSADAVMAASGITGGLAATLLLGPHGRLHRPLADCVLEATQPYGTTRPHATITVDGAALRALDTESSDPAVRLRAAMALTVLSDGEPMPGGTIHDLLHGDWEPPVAAAVLSLIEDHLLGDTVHRWRRG
jgi:hypothetical protein